MSIRPAGLDALRTLRVLRRLDLHRLSVVHGVRRSELEAALPPGAEVQLDNTSRWVVEKGDCGPGCSGTSGKDQMMARA